MLVSARKLAELGVSDQELGAPAQVEVAPRQPQAPELLPDAGRPSTLDAAGPVT